MSKLKAVFIIAGKVIRAITLIWPVVKGAYNYINNDIAVIKDIIKKVFK